MHDRNYRKPGRRPSGDYRRGTARRRRRSSSVSRLAVLALAIGAVFALQQDFFEMAWPSSATSAPDRMLTGALSTSGAVNVAARAIPVCGGGRRVDCIVDGDTLWLDGVKIRLANIDAPELKGRCAAETARAGDATRRLSGLLAGRSIQVRTQGADRYGRVLAQLSTPAGDVGETLVAERRAVRWRGRKEPAGTWCG